MIDARKIYHKVSSTINDFTPEQLKNIAVMVALFRGENEKYLALMKEYLGVYYTTSDALADKTDQLQTDMNELVRKCNAIAIKKAKEDEELNGLVERLQIDESALKTVYSNLIALAVAIRNFREKYPSPPVDNDGQHKASKAFKSIITQIKELSRPTERLLKHITEAVEYGEKELKLRNDKDWKDQRISELKKELEELNRELVELMHTATYYHQQCHWLQSRFPEGKMANVDGLCKVVTRDEVAEKDWSLTPGRYVGVAPVDNGEVNFEERMSELKLELQRLDKEASQLANIIQTNLEELEI